MGVDLMGLDLQAATGATVEMEKALDPSLRTHCEIRGLGSDVSLFSLPLTRLLAEVGGVGGFSTHADQF
jgi:hypothetical protein